MTDAATQLREYLEATVEPVELDEVVMKSIGTSAVRPLEPRQPGRPRRTWLYLPAAAAVALLLAGAAALLIRVTGADSTVATTPIEDPSSLGWSRIPPDAAVFGDEYSAWMSSVTAGGPGLVAVGWVGPHDTGSAAVWTSVDGIAWARVPHDDEIFGSTFGLDAHAMTTVTAGGPGVVAVGWVLDNPWDADAAVWTSPDGITWSRVAHDETLFGGTSYQAMWTVTAGGPGLVAMGEDRSRDSDSGDVAVWTSADGNTWARVPYDEAVFGGPGGQEVRSVTSGASGLVAVGGETFEGDAGSAAVWTSRDGVAWDRVPHDEAIFGGSGEQAMQSVTAGGPGYVAVGWDGAVAAVWTSPDGRSWSRVRHDEGVFASGTGMQSVTSTGRALVAVGWHSDGPGGSAVWTSPDGITWSRVPLDEAVFGEAAISGVAHGGPGLVAVGGAGSDDGDEAAVWIAVPED